MFMCVEQNKCNRGSLFHLYYIILPKNNAGPLFSGASMLNIQTELLGLGFCFVLNAALHCFYICAINIARVLIQYRTTTAYENNTTEHRITEV